MSGKKEFLSGFSRAVAWTAVYGFIMWLILGGLFNFDMFSVAHWMKLRYLHLHSFAGLVFGILILAAVPLYVATMVFTVRTKTMPIKLPLPKCISEGPPAPKVEPVVPVVTEHEPLPELPTGVPLEMREIFMRAKKNYGARQMSVFNRLNAPAMPKEEAPVQSEPATESIMASNAEDTATYGGMPIPTDFDIDAPVDSEPSNDVPVFADINFDDENDSVSKEPPRENPTEKTLKYLRDAGIDAGVDNDLIIANGFAVAVHDDDDFWVPDELEWCAAGKQKPSPIVALKRAQGEQGLKPILYLVTDSIMDLDKNSAEWTADGITVVKDSGDLLNILREK